MDYIQLAEPSLKIKTSRKMDHSSDFLLRLTYIFFTIVYFSKED